MSDRNFLLTPFASCAGTLNKESNEFKQNDVTEIARCCLDFCEPQVTHCRNRCKNNLQEIFKKELNNPDIREKVGWFGKYVKNWNIKESDLGYYDFNSTQINKKRDSSDLSSEGLFTSLDFLNKRCLKSCNITRDVCLGNCRLIDPLTSAYNIYNNCAMKFDPDQNTDFLNLDDIGVNNPSKETVTKYKKEIIDCCLQNCKSKTTNFDCGNYCEFLQNLILNPSKISPAYAEIAKPIENGKLNLKKYKDNTILWIILGILFGLILSLLIIFSLRKNN